MDRRVFVFFCLLTAVTSEESQIFRIKRNGQMVTCDGEFDDGQTELQLSYYNSGVHTCVKQCSDSGNCPKEEEILVKVVGSENLIELNVKDVAIVLISDVLVTVLIGWAVYSICAQPTTRVSYQGNKASDRQALINNHAPGGDTYQRLNTRQDEYSTLHTQRKHKNKQSV